MCGIVGYWDNRGVDASVVENMAQQIRHRGPDSSGVWISEPPILAMAHRRLSIIDLTEAGHQPMLSHIIPTSIVSVSREGSRFHIVIGYAKRKFSTINNGIDIEKFSITSKHKTKDIKIANIARFDLIKDHSNLIKGISLVADDINKQVKYLFIGCKR